MRSPSNHQVSDKNKNAPSASGKGSASNEVKKKAPGFEWQFVKPLHGGYVYWECNYCKASKSGGAPRIRDHFLGSATKSMRRCQSPNVEQVAMRIKEYYQSGNRKASMHINLKENVVSRTMSSEKTDMQSNPASSSVTPNISVAAQNTRDDISFFNAGLSTSNRTRQTSLDESFRCSLLEDAQLAVAKAIYFSGSALSMVDNVHWKAAWKKIGEFGAGFTPPSYHVMRHGMLDKCRDLVKERVDRVILSNLSNTGCTIVCDGWSNVQRRPLINVMVVSPRGETFMRAIDSSGKIKNGEYICDVILQAIEEVGSSNVVQVIMDNAKNCQSAGRLINNSYPHIFSVGCATHSMNLILKDWYKNESTPWFTAIVDDCRQLIKFILKRQRVLDICRGFLSTMLKLPAETRFCTHFYTIESLLQNRAAILDTFSCTAFQAWEAGESLKLKKKVTYIRKNINKDKWWKDVASTYHVMMPVMYGIRALDQSLATVSKVWMTWWTIQRSLECPEELKDSVVQPWQSPFTSKQRKILLKLFHLRWASSHSPIHSAAYFLDPEYWNLDLWSNSEVVKDFYEVVNIFSETEDIRIKCINEAGKFRLKEGSFANTFVQQMAKEQPAWKWWMMNGAECCPNLRPLAIKILAQCASNSSSERNWSTYKYVHSTIRNRLLADKADKLVYMYSNEKILNILESDKYEEGMPVWMYNCKDADDKEETADIDKDQDFSDTENHADKDGATELELELNVALEESVLDEEALQAKISCVIDDEQSDSEDFAD